MASNVRAERGIRGSRRVATLGAVALAVGLSGCADVFLESHPAGAFLPGDLAPEAAPAGVVYSLPTAHVPMLLSRRFTDTGAELSLEFGQPIVFPDPRHTYTLSYTADSMSADEVTVRTSPEGLLSLISTTTRDESVGTALGLVRLVTELAKVASPIGPAAALPLPTLQSGPALTSEPFQLSLVIDPMAEDFEIVVSEALAKIGVYDVTVELSSAMVPGETRNRAELAEYCRVGACYRRAAPVSVTAFDTSFRVGVTSSILLPNNGAVGRVDFTRRAFVENQATAEFEQGMLTALTYVDPSEAAAAANAPVDVVSSILAIPSAVWRSDTATLRAQQDALAAERDLLAERARLIEARERFLEVERAASEGASGP